MNSATRLAALLLATACLHAGPSAHAFTSEDARAARTHADSLRRTLSLEAGRAYLDSLARAHPVADAQSSNARTAARLIEVYRALFEAHAGRHREAKARYETWIEVARADGDLQVLATALPLLGSVESLLGDQDAAWTLQEEAVEVAARVGDSAAEARATIELARLELLTGNVGNAYEMARRGLELFEEAGDEHLLGQLNAWNQLGMAAWGLGDYEQARTCFERIVELGTEAGHLSIAARGLNNLGYYQVTFGHLDAATRAFERAYEVQKSLGNVRSAIIAALNAAEAQSELGRLDEARERFERVFRLAEEHGFLDYQAALLNNLGHLEQRRGRHGEALGFFRRALPIARELERPQEQARSLLWMSRSLAALDSLDAAVELLAERAASLHERLDAVMVLQLEATLARLHLESGRIEPGVELASRSFRKAMAEGVRGIAIGVAPVLSKLFIQAGRPDSALIYLERAADIWEEERALPLDPEWREQRGAGAREVYAMLATLYLGDPIEAPEDPASILTRDPERIAAAFDRLQTFKARTLLERSLGPGVSIDGTVGGQVEIVQMGPLQERVLREDELLLDAYLGGDVGFLFAITRDDHRIFRLPGEDELRRRVELYFDLVGTFPEATDDEEAESGMLRQAAEGLGVLLLDGVHDWITRPRATPSRILFAPDGCLNLVPLASLVPRTEAGASMTAVARVRGPLVETSEVHRIPSASFLARLRAAESRRRGKGVLALAGTTGASGAPLPGAEREVRRLAERFENVELRIGREAAMLVQDVSRMSEFELLHLAGHIAVDDQNPWRSGLLVAPAESETGELAAVVGSDERAAGDAPAPATRADATGADATEADATEADAMGADATGDDLYLRASDVAAARLQADLAVLSGCESAGGRILSGEGVQGLASAFLSAGTPAVVATLWPVDDAGSARFMEVFYDGLAEGETTIGALRSAQLRTRETAGLAHPFHWAGFVLVGDGDVRPTLGSGPRGIAPLWIWIAIVVAAALVVAALVRRRFTTMRV